MYTELMFVFVAVKLVNQIYIHLELVIVAIQSLFEAENVISVRHVLLGFVCFHSQLARLVEDTRTTQHTVNRN